MSDKHTPKPKSPLRETTNKCDTCKKDFPTKYPQQKYCKNPCQVPGRKWVKVEKAITNEQKAASEALSAKWLSMPIMGAKG